MDKTVRKIHESESDFACRALYLLFEERTQSPRTNSQTICQEPLADGHYHIAETTADMMALWKASHIIPVKKAQHSFLTPKREIQSNTTYNN